MAETGEELAKEALASVQNSSDEAAASDKIAETLASLQAVIERNANELLEVSKTLKEKREMLKNTLDNNSEIAEAETKAKALNDELKQKKAKVAASQEVVNLKLEIAEIAQNKREIEETLSSHLVNYHQLTGSTSFDTSDGDQWEFSIQARVKAKKN
ncbi:hypothetical protein IJJ27_01620 [bacterium]|nr:hypothetical protein [bacterium]MBQ6436243.1 hypothetical protein [bacterium]